MNGGGRASKFGTDLKGGRRFVLDGAMGTELERHGMRCDLPLWSARALRENPDAVRAIHKDYIEAGADIITTNTFRTNPRAYRNAGIAGEWKNDARTACELAKAARAAAGRESLSERDVGTPLSAVGRPPTSEGCRDLLIAGSVAPVEDCFRPDLVPAQDELREEHAMLAGVLKEGGADFILAETMNSTREACVAARAAQEIGIPFAVSFVCASPSALLSGERLDDALAAICAFNPLFVAVNCRPPKEMTALLNFLRERAQLPIGVYANGWESSEDRQFGSTAMIERYTRFAAEWADCGAQVIGGCCGTTPRYIKGLRAVVDAA